MNACQMDPKRIARAYKQIVSTMRALCHDYEKEALAELADIKAKRAQSMLYSEAPTLYERTQNQIESTTSTAEAYDVVLGPVTVDWQVAVYVGQIESGRAEVKLSQKFRERYSAQPKAAPNI